MNGAQTKLLATCACLVLGCGAGEHGEPRPEAKGSEPATAISEPGAAPSGSPADPAIGSLAVIAEEATLYAHPDASGPWFPVPLNRPEDLTSGQVVEVVAREGEFVGVQTVSPSLAPQCAGSFGIEAAAMLRFWVRASSLRTVLREAKTLRFDDGASLALVAGTPVSRSGDRSSAHVGTVKIPVELDASELGRGFVPGPARALASATMGVSKQAQLRYGGHSFVGRGGLFGRASSQREVDGELVLRFDTRCGVFELRADAAAIEGVASGEPIRPESAILDLAKAHHAAGIEQLQPDEEDADPCTSWTLAADTALTWTEGSEAGRTLGTIELERAPLERERRLCFDLAAGLGVCVAPGAVSEAVAPDCLAP